MFVSICYLPSRHIPHFGWPRYVQVHHMLLHRSGYRYISTYVDVCTLQALIHVFSDARIYGLYLRLKNWWRCS